MKNMIVKLEQWYDLLSEVVQRQDEGKTSLVDNLLQEIVWRFTNQVVAFHLPQKFKVPDIPIYTGLEDPIEHVDNFQAHLELHGTPEAVARRAFPLNLSGNAQDWFRKLPPEVHQRLWWPRENVPDTILGRKSAKKKPFGSLMSLHQGPNESLKDYLMRFNQEKLTTESPPNKFVYCALIQGIQKDEPLMVDII
jgi:hypothetical protein